jgi:tetratricopeptide (TPR) repeat protein
MRKYLCFLILVSTIQLATPASFALADCDHNLTASDYFLQGQMFAAQGQNEQAIASYTCSIQRDPDYPGIHLQRARLYIAQKNYESAISDYTLYLIFDPGNSEVYALRGLAYGQLDSSERAIADFDRAIELDPNNAPVYLNRSLEFYSQGDDRCLDDVNRYLELRPYDWYGYHWRGVIYSVRQNYEEAIANYNTSAGLNPNNAAVYLSRGDAHAALRDYGLATLDYTRAAELDPASAGSYFLRIGDMYNGASNYDLAITYYSRAIEADPTNASYYLSRANVYDQYPSIDRMLAFADYSRAIELNRTPVDAYVRRGDIYYAYKEYEHAIEDYTRAIELTPDRIYLYDRRAYASFSIDDFEGMVNDYTRMIELEPDDVSHYISRGLIYHRLIRDYEKAAADFRQAILITPDRAFFHRALGDSLFEMGYKDQALASYRRYLELFGRYRGIPDPTVVERVRSLEHPFLVHAAVTLALTTGVALAIAINRIFHFLPRRKRKHFLIG